MISFYKYHGAGNDFVLIDDWDRSFPCDDRALIARMCDRHFGIGADGLMLLQPSNTTHFTMVYFNADGKDSSMCGNGGRCITRFARDLGRVVDDEVRFEAVDGLHRARLLSDGLVALEMIDVQTVEALSDKAVLIDTGSPHYIVEVEDLDGLDVVEEGRKIRYSERFAEEGVNVNFISFDAEGLRIRTYERGVEAETLACGTGVTAAAIAAKHWGRCASPVRVKALGGALSVDFQHKESGYTSIWKTGPTAFVYKGDWKL